MKSTCSTSSGLLIRLVPRVQHQVVAVRVVEERHVTHAGVERVAEELDALRLEVCARGLDVLDVEREMAVVLRLEVRPEPCRFPDRETRVARPKLELPVLVASQAERLAVE